MNTTNISLLRKNLYNSVDNVIEYDEKIMVNTKKGNAVIMSEDEYNSMMETIYLVSKKGMLDLIKNGELENIDEMATYDPKEEW